MSRDQLKRYATGLALLVLLLTLYFYLGPLALP